MFHLKQLKLTFLTLMVIVNYNIHFVRSSNECVIKNKAFPNEYLYQSSKNTKNEIVNGYMIRIDKISHLDHVKWITRMHSNNRITFQNKKTNKYLCAMPILTSNRFDHINNSLNKIKASDLNCIWIQIKSKNEQDNKTNSFLIWNALYFQQLFASNSSYLKSNKQERHLHLYQEKTRLNMTNSFKWIIKC